MCGRPPEPGGLRRSRPAARPRGPAARGSPPGSPPLRSAAPPDPSTGSEPPTEECLSLCPRIPQTVFVPGGPCLIHQPTLGTPRRGQLSGVPHPRQRACPSPDRPAPRPQARGAPGHLELGVAAEHKENRTSLGFDAGRRRPQAIPGNGGGTVSPESQSYGPRAGPSLAPIRHRDAPGHPPPHFWGGSFHFRNGCRFFSE